MMKRLAPGEPGTIVWIVVLLALSGYYLHNFMSQQRMIAAAGSQGEPRQFDVPSLRVYPNASTPLARWELWNLSPKPEGAPPTSNVIRPKPRYAVKSFGHVQGIYSLANQRVRWEFYGVVHQGGEILAVFFNPSLAEEGWVSLGQGQELAPGLLLEDITENRVVIRESEGEAENTWELNLFASNSPR